MTAEEVREIIKMTLDELEQRDLLKTDDYKHMLKVVGVKLNEFFKGTKDPKLSYTLKQLSDDSYIDIIFLQYRDGKTIEWIAEYLSVDVSTVKRNKKRLIKKIYKLLRDS